MGDTLQASCSHRDLLTGDRIQENVDRSVKSTAKVHIENCQGISKAAFSFSHAFHVTALAVSVVEELRDSEIGELTMTGSRPCRKASSVNDESRASFPSLP